MESILITFTLDKFRELIKDAVRSELNSTSVIDSDNTFKKKLITRQKAKELLGVSDPTIIRWEKDGRIKSYRVGGKIFYDLDEIESYILNNSGRSGGGNNG
jgi:excisionase family DNA binding protein